MVILIWSTTALASLCSYVLTALVVDGRVNLGTWEQIGISLLRVLGPIGLLLMWVHIVNQLWIMRSEPWKLPQTCLKYLNKKARHFGGLLTN